MWTLKSVLLLAAVCALTVGCDDSEPTAAPAAKTETKTEAAAKPTTQSIIPVAQMKDWRPEHGVPESICTQCNESLIAGFKAKGDWDAEHNVPKSQCFKCDPSLKEKSAAAYKVKYGEDAPTGGDAH
jgi:hypothetical protein